MAQLCCTYIYMFDHSLRQHLSTVFQKEIQLVGVEQLMMSLHAIVSSQEGRQIVVFICVSTSIFSTMVDSNSKILLANSNAKYIVIISKRKYNDNVNVFESTIPAIKSGNYIGW